VSTRHGVLPSCSVSFVEALFGSRPILCCELVSRCHSTSFDPFSGCHAHGSATALRGRVFERQTDSHAHAKPTQSRGRGIPYWASALFLRKNRVTGVGCHCGLCWPPRSARFRTRIPRRAGFLGRSFSVPIKGIKLAASRLMILESRVGKNVSETCSGEIECSSSAEGLATRS
jgi:hypothetical protein